jgi:serine/threonine protein kinase
MTSTGEQPNQALFDLTGRTIGRYRIVEKIGHGGMAQVYKAYDVETERYVAFKILHPHLTTDNSFATRFKREARAISALDHPHIVHIVDFDNTGTLTYLVMEYLPGISLKAHLQDLDADQALMPLPEVVDLINAIAEGLGYAHGQGIVHRDIKPSNVLLTPYRGPVLTDFGIARVIEATAITDDKSTLGTPIYMSPEQCQGEPVDARSDIYALGVLLYQLCTGRVPFDADTPYAIILKHISAPLPAPTSLRPDLPRDFEAVILKAMSKEPRHRYQTAGEMAQALQAAQETSTRSAPVKRRFSWRPLVAAVLATVLILGLMLLGTLPGRTPSDAKSTAVAVAVGSLEISGPDQSLDTWLNPDLPDEVWHETDLVHLQGPLTPDRLLFWFDLSALPAEAHVTTATLAINLELWGDEAFPGAGVVYQVLTPWEAESSTHNTPWNEPGLLAGVDYDFTPLDIVPIQETGRLTFDVTKAVRGWYEEGKPNYGLVIMISEDSHNMAHWWVYMSEQADTNVRPALQVAYEAAP